MHPQAAKIRQQAADLIARIAVVMKACDEEKLLGHLGVVLYEYLGEEYPEVLGSILGALKVCFHLLFCCHYLPTSPCFLAFSTNASCFIHHKSSNIT